MYIKNNYYLLILCLFFTTNCSIYEFSKNRYVNKIFHQDNLIIKPYNISNVMIVDSFPLELDIRHYIAITNISIQTPNTIYSINPEFSTDNITQHLKLNQDIFISNQGNFNSDNSHYPITITMRNINNDTISTNLIYNVKVKSPHYTVTIPDKIPSNDEDWYSRSFALGVTYYPTGVKINKINIYSDIGFVKDIPKSEDFENSFIFEIGRLGARPDKSISISIEIVPEFGELIRQTYILKK